MRFTPASTKGFTLLEVLVAMAILATVLVVLLENHSMSIRMSVRARQTSIAANLARDLITEVEIEGYPEVGSEQGDFNEKYPGLYPGYVWVREVNDSSFVDYVREVLVRVTYLDNGIPRSIELIDLIGAKDLQDQAAAGIGSDGTGNFTPGEQAMMSSMGRSGGGESSGGSE